MAIDDRRQEWLSAAGMLLIIAALWMAQHPYFGIEGNDSSLYSLPALARLHPSLSTDVFLRYGSQDSFTVFSPLFAGAIKLFDLEPAAAILSFLSQIAFFGCAWLIARSLMPTRWALLAVGLLVVLPSDYGSHLFFSYSEGFLTPRPSAEALTLAAIASSLRGRPAVAAACLLGGMMLHPIMAFAGVVMLACLHVAVPRPRLALAFAAALVLVTVVPILIAPQGPFARFDFEWFEAIKETATYLFTSTWRVQDWAHLAVSAAVLGVGALTSGGVVRRLSVATLLLAAASVAVNWLYCDVLHSVMFTRLQAWRWTWLVEALSVLLLPIIVRDCWRSGPLARCAVVLLAVAWVLRNDASALWVTLACIACAALKTTSARTARVALLGSWLALAFTIMWTVPSKLQYVELNAATSAHQPLLNTQMLRTWTEDGVFYAAALLVAWWVLEIRRRWPETLVFCALAIGTCLWLLPLAWQSWTTFQYTQKLHDLFNPWRSVIPERAEVVWPQTAMGAWYLLERPSYYSREQFAGEIFSRDKTFEMRRRARWVSSTLQAAPAGKRIRSAGSRLEEDALPRTADGLGARGVTLLCGDPELDFYVTRAELDAPAAAAPVSPFPAKPQSQLHLYRCSDLRKRAG